MKPADRVYRIDGRGGLHNVGRKLPKLTGHEVEYLCDGTLLDFYTKSEIEVGKYRIAIYIANVFRPAVLETLGRVAKFLGAESSPCGPIHEPVCDQSPDPDGLAESEA